MKLILTILCGLLLGGGSVQAAVFLKLDGVEGESTDANHRNEIDVLSWSWGLSHSGTAVSTGGAGAGRVSMQDLSITKLADRATTEILTKAATGTHIPVAVLTLRRASGDGQSAAYYKITMHDVVVSSFSTGGSAGEERPVETLSLNFEEIKVEYTMQKADGSAGTTTVFEHNLATEVIE